MVARRAQIAQPGNTRIKPGNQFASPATSASIRTKRDKRSAMIVVPANFNPKLGKVNVMRARQASSKPALDKIRAAAAILPQTQQQQEQQHRAPVWCPALILGRVLRRTRATRATIAIKRAAASRNAT